MKTGEEERRENKSMIDHKKERELGMKWYWFYINIKLPIKILTGVIALVIYPSLLTKTILLLLLILSLATWHGLRKMTRWGWQLNFIYLIVEGAIVILSSDTPLERTISTLLATFAWFLPNFIYFEKRKSLFIN